MAHATIWKLDICGPWAGIGDNSPGIESPYEAKVGLDYPLERSFVHTTQAHTVAASGQQSFREAWSYMKARNREVGYDVLFAEDGDPCYDFEYDEGQGLYIVWNATYTITTDGLRFSGEVNHSNTGLPFDPDACFSGGYAPQAVYDLIDADPTYEVLVAELVTRQDVRGDI